MKAKLIFKFVIEGRAYMIEGAIDLLQFELASPETWMEVGAMIGGTVADAMKIAEKPEMQPVPEGTTLQ